MSKSLQKICKILILLRKSKQAKSNTKFQYFSPNENNFRQKIITKQEDENFCNLIQRPKLRPWHNYKTPFFQKCCSICLKYVDSNNHKGCQFSTNGADFKAQSIFFKYVPFFPQSLSNSSFLQLYLIYINQVKLYK